MPLDREEALARLDLITKALIELPDKVKDALKLFRYIKRKTVFQFALLNKIKDYLEETEDKPIKERSRKCFRWIRYAKRAEWKTYPKIEKLLEKLKEISDMLPRVNKIGLQETLDKNQIPGIEDGIKIYADRLLKYVRKELPAELDDPSDLYIKADEAISEALTPFIEVIKIIHDYLKDHEADFPANLQLEEKKLRQENEFTVDFDRAFRIENVPMATAEVLLDADFITHLDEERRRRKNSLYNIRLTPRARIPKAVIRELRTQGGVEEKALVIGNTLNYFTTVLRVPLLEINPTQPEKDRIVRFWKEETRQGQAIRHLENSIQERRFRNSGDMALLTRAMRRGINNPTVILTDNYSEIGYIASRMTREGLARVRVLTKNETYLRAA
ncbi:MAG: hypothetical protein V3V78_00695 [Candidatus Woesearchaeota archaeon]